MQEAIDEKARLIQKLITDLGWDIEFQAFHTRIQQLDLGLIQEDEFIFVLNWSNKFKLIHKLEQNQIPGDSKKDVRVPDLLVIHNEKGQEVPYLIEIKTTEKDQLSWSEKYYNSLLNYSKQLNIPLLIAWKWRLFNLWTLFDATHFEKPKQNFKISFKNAIKKNLMSRLAGDFMIMAYDGFSLIFRFKKLELISKTEKEKDYKVVLDDYYFSGKNNKLIRSKNPAYFAIILSQFTEEIVTECDNYINVQIKPQNTSFFSQSMILNLMKGIARGDDIKWFDLAKKGKYPFEYDSFLEFLKKGSKEKIIEKVIFTIPA